MKKSVKITVVAGALVILAFVVAAAVLYAVVDTQRIKTTLSDMVREHTGRELVFKGDVGISVFPWLGVELGRVSLSNAPGFGDAPFAEIRRTDVKVKLLPLLSRDVQVKNVVIDGLSLNLARNGQGRTNWDDLTRAGEADASEPTPEASGEPAAGQDGSPLLAGLAVDGISLTDAGLTWSDGVSGQRYSLSKTSLTTGPVALGRPFDFSFVATAEAAEPALSGEVRLAARADPGKDFSKPRLSGLTLTASADGESVPGGHVDVSLGGDILVNLNDSTITVDKLKLSAMDVDVSGGFTVAKFDTAPVVRASLSFSEFSPRELMRALGLPPLETTDPKALQKASGSIEATATTDSATVRKLDLTVDDTALSGSAEIRHFAKPSIAFDLKADVLDVNRYLPPADDAPEDDKAPASADDAATGNADAKTDKTGLPKEQLRALNVDGKLRVDRLTVHKLRLNDLSVTVKARDGLIRITPLSAGLYGGRIKTALTADMRSDVTRSALDMDLSGLMLGGLLKDFLGQDKVTGLAKARLKLSGAGENWKTLAGTLTGNGAVSLADGVFKGFQVLPDKVRRQAAANSKDVARADVEKQQPFRDISASFAVRNGVVTTGDTSLAADGLGGTGQGMVDLARGYIDYRAVVDLAALPRIPFTVKGDWADPDISLDTVAFLEETARTIIKAPVNLGKGAGQVGQDLIKGGGKVLEGIGSGILDIFGGKKKEKK